VWLGLRSAQSVTNSKSNDQYLKVSTVIIIGTGALLKCRHRCGDVLRLSFVERINDDLLRAADFTPAEWTRHAIRVLSVQRGPLLVIICTHIVVSIITNTSNMFLTHIHSYVFYTCVNSIRTFNTRPNASFADNSIQTDLELQKLQCEETNWSQKCKMWAILALNTQVIR